jgi:amidohydrolase
MRQFLPVVLCVAAVPLAAAQQDSKLVSMVDQELPTLVATYKNLHAAPELSHHEEKTSALLAERLRSFGYEVTEHVGKYPNPNWKGYGVVAVLKNGAGPTLLVRADMDALPVEEKTGLPYASKVHSKDDSGTEVPVMHACGHDVHVTALLGTAKMLSALKNQWRGTLVLIGQPAEERIDGARAMLADGLYTRFPKPDYLIALHDNGDTQAGKILFTPGYALASATSIDVTIRGRSSHGSRPESSKDPIVMAAEYVLAIQTIVSRERSPFDPVVVTVGSIHGGTKHNIIPDEVHLQLSIRTYKDEVRQQVIASLERIARGIAIAGGVPEDRLPTVEASKTEYTPSTYNDPALTTRVVAAIRNAIGKDNVTEAPPVMASEDFAYFSLENHQIPAVMFALGAIDLDRFAASDRGGAPLPSLHSGFYYPAPEPTLRTGVIAMTAAVLDLLKK